MLILLEDAHWADATTLELVRLLVNRIGNAPLLLVIASRSDGLPSLPAPPHLTRLTLNRLGRSAIASIVGRLIAGRDQAPTLLDEVVARTDGVPLFVEELAKVLAERVGELDGQVEVPASLHDALMARLDRLPGAKDIAQIAACIGREFDHRLLAVVADLGEAELARQLDQLCAAELLFRRGALPEATYTSKHALVRDAAYTSLLKSRRRAIHARVLAALERGVVSAAAEDAGRHAAAAELWAKALHHYGAAGTAALDRGATAEGLRLVAKALDAGKHLTGDITAEVAMIDLRRAHSWAYLTLGDTSRMMTELREAENRAARFGMARLNCQLKAQRTHMESIFGGNMRRAMRHGREAVRIAAALGDADLASASRSVLGLALLIAGDFRSSVAELEVDADNCRQSLRMVAVVSSGTLAVDALAVLGHALGQLGRWEEAHQRGVEARAVAAETGSAWDMHIANYHFAATLLARGDYRSALPLIEWNVEYGKRSDLRTVPAWCLSLAGHASLLAGCPDEAIDQLDRSIHGCMAMYLHWTSTYAHLIKAEACLAAGRTDASQAAATALELACAHGYRAFEATALRLLAAGLSAGDRAAALQHLAAARAIAATLALPLESCLIDAEQARLDDASR